MRASQVSAWVMALIVSLTMLGQLGMAQDTIPGWHTNLEEARKLAESTGKPLFITFRCVR